VPRSLRTVLASVTAGILAGSGLLITTPAAVAGQLPESSTRLDTAPQPVRSTTGKDLILTLGAERHSRASKPDAHAASKLTATLTNLNGTESHAWTFDLAKDSFRNASNADGQLKTGHQVAPYGSVDLSISAAHKGVKHDCGAGDFSVTHKVTLKGSVKLRTHSAGPSSWGTVKLRNITLKGKLYGGHGPDNEEACTGFPVCLHGISWLASKGDITLSGDLVGAQGDHPIGTIRGDRYTELLKPVGGFRLDEVIAGASHQRLTKLNGTKTLSVVADAAQPAVAGGGTLTATAHSPWATGCAGGQEKGKLWTAKYVAADQPLTFAEEIFGPISLAKAGATFEKYHVA